MATHRKSGRRGAGQRGKKKTRDGVGGRATGARASGPAARTSRGSKSRAGKSSRPGTSKPGTSGPAESRRREPGAGGAAGGVQAAHHRATQDVAGHDRPAIDSSFVDAPVGGDSLLGDSLLMDPLVAIVGRPNVGKSTLFNRLTRSRRSIVGDEPGITRDRIYGEYEWAGRQFRLVDTGGIVPDDEALIPAEIFRQARVALDEAAALVMVVDGRTELARPDYDLVRLLARENKPLFLAVNKVEGDATALEAENFRRLGIREVYPVSAEHGLGIGELLDAISEKVGTTKQGNEGTSKQENRGQRSGIRKKRDEREEPAAGPADGESGEPGEKRIRTHGEYEQHETSIAIIGRPNVGKSTLLNALTGTTRAIVSPIAGTTRDAVDEVVEFEGARLRFVDTAGIRRKGKTKLMAEKMSVVMARKHLEAADVALLVIDATDGVRASDATIGGYAHESGRSVIVIVNKWDAVTTARTDGKPAASEEIFEKQLRSALKYLDYAPVLFLSALEATEREAEGQTAKSMGRVLRAVMSVAKERRKRVSTGQMNRFLERVDFQRAPVPMSKRMRVLYMTQASVAPPTFILFTDRAVELHFAFERFLENQIRAAFGFEGTPIWFKVRARGAGNKGTRK